MVIKYIGRTHTFKGKPLWEILGNLKNHGVGRMVIRSAQQKYPEVSYMRILKVVGLPDTSKHIHVHFFYYYYVCQCNDIDRLLKVDSHRLGPTESDGIGGKSFQRSKISYASTDGWSNL